MYILGIESSCDETGIAIYSIEKGLLANEIYSQIKTHQRYGGVVPEIASRSHSDKLLPLLELALDKAKLNLEDINYIAYTKGPGLKGALLAGVSFAKALAYSLNIQTIAVNHMEGHLLAPFMQRDKLSFPFLALLVSGGHTQLIYAQSLGNYKLLGETLDDAVGEAFDKIGKMLGLNYPAGAELSNLAESGADKFNLPRPMINHKNYDFSFSGLKTAAMLKIKELDLNLDNNLSDMAKSVENAIIDTLVSKSFKAASEFQVKELIVSGGVSANLELRRRLKAKMNEISVEVSFPEHALCTDNGAMIAYAGALRLNSNYDLNINVKPRWSLEEI